jgi:hypothetical protein
LFIVHYVFWVNIISYFTQIHGPNYTNTSTSANNSASPPIGINGFGYNSIGEPSVKLHGICENPKKRKSRSNPTIKLTVFPIDSSSHLASKTLGLKCIPIIEGLTPILIIDLNVNNTKTNIKDKVKLASDLVTHVTIELLEEVHLGFANKPKTFYEAS